LTAAVQTPLAVRDALAFAVDAVSSFAAVGGARARRLAVVFGGSALVGAHDRARIRRARARAVSTITIDTAAFAGRSILTRTNNGATAIGLREMRLVEVDAGNDLTVGGEADQGAGRAKPEEHAWSTTQALILA